MEIDGLRAIVERFVLSYAAESGVKNWWRRPLLTTARVDERFNILPTVAFNEHLLPWELLPSAKTVIVFFLPFIRELVEGNSQGAYPCRNWGLAYEAANDLIGALAERIKGLFQEEGYKSALTPATHNFDPVRLVSRWSHKHLGYISGLGRFGINAQLITPSGCAGRLGSLVTEAVLGDNPIATEQELCLHKAGLECLRCLRRCPVVALELSGINRKRCFDRLRFNLEKTEALDGLRETTHVCGKCVAGVPCSIDSPKRGNGPK